MADVDFDALPKITSTKWVFQVTDRPPDVGRGTRGLGPLSTDIGAYQKLDTLCTYFRDLQSREAASRPVSRAYSSQSNLSRQQIHELHEAKVRAHTQMKKEATKEEREYNKQRMKEFQEQKKTTSELQHKLVEKYRRDVLHSREQLRHDLEKSNQWLIEENIASKSMHKMYSLGSTEDTLAKAQNYRRRLKAERSHMLTKLVNEVKEQHEGMLKSKRWLDKCIVDMKSRQEAITREKEEDVQRQRRIHANAMLRAKEGVKGEVTTAKKYVLQNVLLRKPNHPKEKSQTLREYLRGSS
eukprot:PhF_6_TR38152/c0_g1_i1/m.56989